MFPFATPIDLALRDLWLGSGALHLWQWNTRFMLEWYTPAFLDLCAMLRSGCKCLLVSLLGTVPLPFASSTHLLHTIRDKSLVYPYRTRLYFSTTLSQGPVGNYQTIHLCMAVLSPLSFSFCSLLCSTLACSGAPLFIFAHLELRHTIWSPDLEDLRTRDTSVRR